VPLRGGELVAAGHARPFGPDLFGRIAEGMFMIQGLRVSRDRLRR
jgi:hypothetical protein